MFKYLVLPIVVIALLATAWFWASLSWSFSTGERAGWVQKLSNKGWLCKTWEGELALVTMPGTVAEKFFFTVRDDGIAARINQSMGRRVTLDYHQHVGIPSSCFGETGYFLTGVHSITEPTLTPDNAPAAAPTPTPTPTPAAPATTAPAPVPQK